MTSTPSGRRILKISLRVSKRTLFICLLSAVLFIYVSVLTHNLNAIVTSDLDNRHQSTVCALDKKKFEFNSANIVRSQRQENRMGLMRPISHNSSIGTKKISKDLCPILSPLLVGWSDIPQPDIANWKENEDVFSSKMAKAGVTVGGKYMPMKCQARNKAAIIVPYRKRKTHLQIFLRYMHPFLQRQQLQYVIVVVEQSEGSPFNRGMLMNIGFQETQFREMYECFIFHDVDLLPENDGNPYTCPDKGRPRQMAFSIDIYDYRIGIAS